MNHTSWTLRRAWTLSIALLLVDLVTAERAGLVFHSWLSLAPILGFLFGVGFIYGDIRLNSRLAEAANYAAIWVAFSTAGAIFTYVVATLRFPLRDADLARIDLALGFHWLTWFALTARHGFFKSVLAIAYATMLPQIVLSILYFAHMELPNRNRELLWTSIFALIATTVISGLCPAVGPYLGDAMPPWSRILLAIRDGSASTFFLGNMQGIIAMPSFHTVTALLLIYTHRPPSKSFYPVAILNGLMLLAVPSEGHHYLVDEIAGAIIAIICIYIVRAGIREPSEKSPVPANLPGK